MNLLWQRFKASPFHQQALRKLRVSIAWQIFPNSNCDSSEGGSEVGGVSSSPGPGVCLAAPWPGAQPAFSAFPPAVLAQLRRGAPAQSRGVPGRGRAERPALPRRLQAPGVQALRRRTLSSVAPRELGRSKSAFPQFVGFGHL